jgi:hypothetical protein
LPLSRNRDLTGKRWQRAVRAIETMMAAGKVLMSALSLTALTAWALGQHEADVWAEVVPDRAGEIDHRMSEGS